MAWGSHAERLAAVEDKARTAEARAQEHRAREASCRVQGKLPKAEAHARTAARQERIATTHRQEIDRLDSRARQQARRSVSAAQRAHEMARAEERASAAAAAQPAVDPLHAYTEALETAAALEADAQQADKRARGYTRAGDQRKAEIATGGAARSRQRAAEWRAEAERIQAATSRDLPRELKLAVKTRRRLDSQAKNETKRLADLGVVEHLGTAAGQREIASGGRVRDTPMARLREYASLIRKPQERTEARLKTMKRFDTLCATADAGLFPEPRFEHESGSGKGPGDTIMANRAAGLAEMQEIASALGADVVAMLRAWIYDRQTQIALVRAGYASEKMMGRILLAAVDSLAVFLTTQNALDARLAGMGVPLRARPSDAEADRPAACPPQGFGPENANSGEALVSQTQPEKPLPARRRPPANGQPQRPTISCPEEISDAARRTILARGGRVPGARA